MKPLSEVAPGHSDPDPSSVTVFETLVQYILNQ